MTPQRVLRAALIFVALVAMHYFVRPLMGWRVSMDFLVIAMLLVAVRVRPGVAAVVGVRRRSATRWRPSRSARARWR